jgi:glycolate oxidase
MTTSIGTEIDLAGVISSALPQVEVLPASTLTHAYLHDRSIRDSGGAPDRPGPTVALPTSAAQVQELVRLAERLGVAIVPRGAGTGLSGGAEATSAQLVISTEKLTKILEINPADQVAVVEPGVLNADLGRALEEYGLFYAPDPASFKISSLGGNVATNAGGLRCAKYGVTRESVLALDVVLSDGELVSVGHRSVKGVTGLDLVSLFVGSEGTLGIVVGLTVRARNRPPARRTLVARFPDTSSGAHGIEAVTRSPVEPAIVEFLDATTAGGIVTDSGRPLAVDGQSVALIELDGFGLDEQAELLTQQLGAVGATVSAHEGAEAEVFWELRRSGRALPTQSHVLGEDVAVPKSQLPALFAALGEIAERYAVSASAVAHAGDGNLHPAFAGESEEAVEAAADELVRRAVALGGTVSGEHGIGTAKHRWLDLELSERNRELQRAIKAAVDPAGLFNPGKAL